MDKIGIIGAGAWGTALAVLAQSAGRRVQIWAREPEVAEAINSDKENTLFLSGVILPPEIQATTDLSEVVKVDALMLVVPSQYLRQICGAIAPYLDPSIPVVICAKGIETGSGALMNEIVECILPKNHYAVLSGPTFAAEVARNEPAAVTLACQDIGVGKKLTRALGTSRFRIYQSTDVIGAEIGGAVKNVIAIACGIVEGRSLGDSARAAIITRGLAEMARLSRAKGGRPETLMGLSGIGDLTLTCNAIQSRNFSLGVALGKGQRLDQVLASRVSVAEGVDTAASIDALAELLKVDAPICSAVNSIANHGADTESTISSLLARPIGLDSPFD